jgi:hypothetical protein
VKSKQQSLPLALAGFVAVVAATVLLDRLEDGVVVARLRAALADPRNVTIAPLARRMVSRLRSWAATHPMNITRRSRTGPPVSSQGS